MSKVYFYPINTQDNQKLGLAALKTLKSVLETEGKTLQPQLGIKVHFGEKGNHTFIPATCYDPVIDYLKSSHIEPSYIETNVLYRGARTTLDHHVALAHNHGFTQIPIIIADGEKGTDYNEIPIDKDFIKSCKIGKAYENFSQYLVFSHFKGHAGAGFGGALKQLAMGFAARGGKLAQHSDISPIVNAKKCIVCGLCVEKCDVDAIRLEEAAVIDSDLCIGCAGCIAVCPEGAIRNDWGGSNFLQKIAEYAYGAALNKDNIYISFIHNITADCDCMGKSMDCIADNIGIMASTDPVALDTACLDVLQQTTHERLFESGRPTLHHAEKIGLGSMTYHLIKIQGE